MTETCRCGADLLDGRCIAYCPPLRQRHLMRRSPGVGLWVCMRCGLIVTEGEIADSRYWMKGDLLAACYEAERKEANCGRG